MYDISYYMFAILNFGVLFKLQALYYSLKHVCNVSGATSPCASQKEWQKSPPVGEVQIVSKIHVCEISKSYCV